MALLSVNRVFRIMDDNGSKSLDFDEFKKGLGDYGLVVSDGVSSKVSSSATMCENGSC